MAAVAAGCSIANRVDVLSKTLENLKFNWEETGGNDRRSRFAKCPRDFEENHLGMNEKATFIVMELEILERKIKKLVNKLKKAGIHLFVFDADDIEYGATIGKGGEGIVQCCTVKYNGLCIRAAVKTVLNNSDDSLNLTLDEIELLCLAHDLVIPTTIQIYGVAAVPDDADPEMGHLVIITEAGLMNALQFFQSENIPYYVTYDIWSQLAAALHCIHMKKIIHQDLKPENILITRILRDSCGHLDKVEVKVIDFGMARLVDGDRIYTDDILGTDGYHAPEVLFDDCYDFHADIFVLGITFCVMLLPRSSLKRLTLLPLLKRIHEAKQKRFVGSCLYDHVISPMITNNDLISNNIRNMICSMLELVENRTITLLDVAHICHKESVLQRHHQINNAPSASVGLLYHHDSGVDSLENAAVSDVVPKKNARSKRVRATPRASSMMSSRRRRASKTPGTVRHRRHHARLASCSSSSEQNSSDGPPHGNIPHHLEKNAATPTRTSPDEPVCRRTRSAKRLHGPVADASSRHESNGGCSRGSKNPPAKRMLRSTS